mmetsp:Transcript_21978/g.32463  ORF Transcript_21978/g.32463 Transcript_21978/m.32463 type:complete len:184 (+) Transcript_21978:123-674(+)|eukprot:CAMPEP_0194211950 /NCGR_PEP_ID=MMETSP0156-20130528/11375_1 /TAXON_ID=33649 /ORGANISM="Thalassionema nitzschioides, Strain L26-B" /LENGTH=183 /DNA_ID=CAMNT_0038939641 /DNA_START=42 /DNA_END=593 /DNA_ORIENTATION=+
MSEEPEAKKMKTTGWEDHTMNISEAVMKADEGSFLTSLSTSSVETLQGIGPKSDAVLEALNVNTVEHLATYKYFLISRAIVALAETETEGGRPAGSTMNIDKAVDKEFESKSLKEIAEAPTSALQGLSEKARTLFEELHVKTIKDLANFKYCRIAEAIVQAAKFEETKTEAERKAEKLAKQLE